MSKYIATLTNDRGDVPARNIFELQSALCKTLQVPDKVLTYHLLRSAALNTLNERSKDLLHFLGVAAVSKAYKNIESL